MGVENAKILVPGWLPRDLTIVRHEMTTPLISVNKDKSNQWNLGNDRHSS